MPFRRTRAPLRAVLFDWDGTLLDSYHADAHAYLGMFHALGIPWGLEQLARHYSPDWLRVYRAAGIPRHRWEEADRLWRHYYAQRKPALMPGARQVLRTLRRRYLLGLVTGGNGVRVREQLRRFGFTGLFAARVCTEDARHRKPHPAPLQLALRHLRLAPEECVYVGDAPEDIQMAHRAGMRAIGVLGAFPTEENLRAARPEALLPSIRRLPGLLRSY